MLQGDASSTVMLQQPHHAALCTRFDSLSCLLALLENNFAADFRVMLQEKQSFVQTWAYMKVADSRKSFLCPWEMALQQGPPHPSCFTAPSHPGAQFNPPCKSLAVFNTVVAGKQRSVSVMKQTHHLLYRISAAGTGWWNTKSPIQFWINFYGVRLAVRKWNETKLNEIKTIFNFYL